jgi:hypothetical protein
MGKGGCGKGAVGKGAVGKGAVGKGAVLLMSGDQCAIKLAKLHAICSL